MRKSFIDPLLYPNLYGKISKGLLLYGPPGVGKTFVVKAAINELQKAGEITVLFYAPITGQLKGKFFGETERNIKKKPSEEGLAWKLLWVSCQAVLEYRAFRVGGRIPSQGKRMVSLMIHR
jgi:hypothetical protein